MFLLTKGKDNSLTFRGENKKIGLANFLVNDTSFFTTTKRIKQTTCFVKIIQIKCKNNKNGGKIKIVHKNKMKNCAIRVYSRKKAGGWTDILLSVLTTIYRGDNAVIIAIEIGY